MDFYSNAYETEQAAKSLFENEFYRQSIYFSCLAVELYFKSKLHLVEHHIDLEASHNIVGLYTALTNRFPFKSNVMPMWQLTQYAKKPV